MSALRVNVLQDGAYELHKRLPSERDTPNQIFVVSVSLQRPTAGCLAFRWRMEASGTSSASPVDFARARWPAGTVVFFPTSDANRLDAASQRIAVAAIDDRLTEANETFRLVFVDAAGHVIWGHDPAAAIGEAPRARHSRVQVSDAVFTLYDTPRRCAYPADWQSYSVALEADHHGLVRLVVRRRFRDLPRQCLQVDWRVVSVDNARLVTTPANERKGSVRFAAASDGEVADVEQRTDLMLQRQRPRRPMSILVRWGSPQHSQMIRLKDVNAAS